MLRRNDGPVQRGGSGPAAAPCRQPPRRSMLQHRHWWDAANGERAFCAIGIGQQACSGTGSQRLRMGSLFIHARAAHLQRQQARAAGCACWTVRLCVQDLAEVWSQRPEIRCGCDHRDAASRRQEAAAAGEAALVCGGSAHLAPVPTDPQRGAHAGAPRQGGRVVSRDKRSHAAEDGLARADPRGTAWAMSRNRVRGGHVAQRYP
jgi:hypothetical protein